MISKDPDLRLEKKLNLFRQILVFFFRKNMF